MPKTTKVKKKVSKPKTKTKAKAVKTKTKTIAKPKVAAKASVKISKTYVPKDTEKYMCEKHKIFFRMRLTEWKKELVKANNEALYFGSMDDNSISADVVDQASSYTDKNVEMNCPDITGLYNESHSHKRYPQGRDPGGNCQEPEVN